MSALFEFDAINLECPLCFQEFKGSNTKVFQCQNGHSYCEDCFNSFIWSKKKKCSICSVKIRDKIRNTVAEVLAEKAIDDSKVGLGSTVKKDQPKTPEKIEVHDATCDGAHSQLTVIHGQRYKCTQCRDFDLCSKCFNQGLHKEHLFMCLRDDRDTQKFKENAAKSSIACKSVTRSRSRTKSKKSMPKGEPIDEPLPKRKRLTNI